MGYGNWISQEQWHKCVGDTESIKLPEKLKGKECWAGLNVTGMSFASFVMVFHNDDDTYDILPVFWMTRNSTLYGTSLSESGFIIIQEGDIISHDDILKHILDLSLIYKIQEIALDPWNCVSILQQLENAKIKTYNMHQGISTMSPPTKYFYALVRDERLHHGNNPILNWMIEGANINTDAAGNVRLNSELSHGSLCGIKAAIMGLDRALNSIKLVATAYSQIKKPIDFHSKYFSILILTSKLWLSPVKKSFYNSTDIKIKIFNKNIEIHLSRRR